MSVRAYLYARKSITCLRIIDVMVKMYYVLHCRLFTGREEPDYDDKRLGDAGEFPFYDVITSKRSIIHGMGQFNSLYCPKKDIRHTTHDLLCNK